MSGTLLRLGLAASIALAAIPADAQVSVQVGDNGEVRVDTGNGTRVYSSNSTRVRDGNGTSSTVIRSYQYQGGNESEWSLNRDDTDDCYLVLQAPPGRLLRGRVLLNGRLLTALDRPSLVVPLAGLLQGGTNRIELRGPTGEVSVGIASGGNDRPYFRGRRLYGAERTLVQTLSGSNRTILLRVAP